MTPNFTHWGGGRGRGRKGKERKKDAKEEGGWRGKKEERKELQKTHVAAAAMCGRDISEEIPI